MEKLDILLKEKKLTISVVESCTSGLLASYLTSIPGSSAYFIGGIVAYSRNVKRLLLDVPEHIEVVSDKCVVAMNQGLKKMMTSDIYVSVTGYIGPTADDPELLGTIYFSIMYNNIDHIFKIKLEICNRSEAKKKIVLKIIDAIYKIIKGPEFLLEYIQ